MPAYPVSEFAPPQDTAHRETAEREDGAVIALYLFCRIAHMGQAVRTAGTDAVRAAGQGDVRVIPAEERQLFRHVCGESITVAVTAEKGGTQPWWGRSLYTLDQPFREALCNEDRQRHLYAVRQNEREYAPAQCSQQSYRTGVLSIDDHEPRRTKGIAHRQSQHQRQDHDRQLVAQEVGDEPVEQSGEQKADDIAAGRARTGCLRRR